MARILVVDDSAFQRRHLRGILEAGGHDVIEAGDGKEGVAVACKEKPDLIMTDLLMPVADGFTLLKSMHNRGAHIPILVVSSNVQDAAQQECRRLGAVGFVPKPVKPESLHDALKGVIG